MTYPRALVAVLAASLLAAGCSGSDDDTTAAPDAVATVESRPETPVLDTGADTVDPALPGTDPSAAPTGSPDPGNPAAGTTPAPEASAATDAVGRAKDNVAAVTGGKQPAAGPAVVKLGGVFPLSGPLGSVGTAMMESVQAVIAQTNAAGGVRGTKFELVVEDDQFDPVRGKAVVQKLIEQDKVFAFAGIFSPFTTQAALPVIRAAKVPVFPSGSDDREFGEPMLFPVTNPCGRQMAGNVQHLVSERKLAKLAVVYVNVEAVSNCAKYFTAVAKKLGADVVFNGATAPGAPDCASRMVAARASGAEALIVITENLGTVKCLQAKDQLGWDVPVSISYNNTDDPVILRGAGKAGEGMLSSSPFTGASSAAFAEQCGAIKKFYPESRLQFFSIVGCLGTKLLIEGVKIGGFERTGLISALESGRTFSFGDLVPPLSYANDQHLPYDLTATVEVKDGTWVRVGKLYTPAGVE
ncbi:ABC transporter substrate-binding protein [Sporichthya polymorpha]|uniref:ABC transporter substrate-binding protein n=1 Tax=Sporichthya polymorpha TaxID=35751 RepID=UPI0003787A9D|nr:ABC transporter substrate-binding protein [Sporichthya polymorpha]